MKKVEILEHSDPSKFQADCEILLNDGYEMEACSCGFVQSEQYDFCSAYHAVFVKSNAANQVPSDSDIN